MNFYPWLRPLLFRMDSESAHRIAILSGQLLQSIPGLMRPENQIVAPNPRLTTNVGGIPFETPLGLAAGFDKSGQVIPLMQSLGFGHLEIGSISSRPSLGNPRPRLWRMIDHRGVLVHYGLPNDGAEHVAARLAKLQTRGILRKPLGINLVNTNDGPSVTPDSGAVIADYVQSATLLAPFASYLMLNLSCPNTVDGRGFFETTGRIGELLQRIEKLSLNPPLLLKVSPDWDDHQFDQLIETALESPSVAGLMLNLSAKQRDVLGSAQSRWSNYPGAVAGAPIKAWMNERTAWLYQKTKSTRLRLLSAGGIESANDVWQRMESGASLVQLYTALIYEGPRLVRQINRLLASRLEKEGVNNVADIVGTNAG
ncbi:quinone-dependent dihydroorotate dehydrogenase [Rhodopirellula sp. MGV]|uniref:quinone-dependent dihydroorotate dehydrogenase n=1 Tax=Rhodopirellula sp. MGV TaxID=2023130 RepID=UPI0013041443|nr:quinone-dependent dihydroorotate dehydrogenase [Rhodopirellula sp. MGV]